MIVIRKAALNDAEIIATCFLLAMEKIVYGFIGEENVEKAREFMVHFIERDDNQYSYQNCWVAEVEMEVVAAVNLYNGAQLNDLRKPVIEYLGSRFNRDFTPGDETQAGEYYIDCIGVMPNQQGKGYGTKLLQFVMNEYLNKQHQTLGLLVDDENPHAKKMYLGLGFKSVGKRVLFGKNLEHLQISG